MRPDRVIRIARAVTASAVVVMALGACGGMMFNTSPPPARFVIIGPTSIEAGSTAQLEAQVILSARQTTVVTRETAWSSSDAALLMVSPTGVLHGLRVGTAEVRAKHYALMAKKIIEVRAAP